MQYNVHYSFLMSQKTSCFAVAWDLAPCPHFHYLPNDLLHHQAGDRKGKVSNFRWLWDRKIGSGILSSGGQVGVGEMALCWCIEQNPVERQNSVGPFRALLASIDKLRCLSQSWMDLRRGGQRSRAGSSWCIAWTPLIRGNSWRNSL